MNREQLIATIRRNSVFYQFVNFCAYSDDQLYDIFIEVSKSNFKRSKKRFYLKHTKFIEGNKVVFCTD